MKKISPSDTTTVGNLKVALAQARAPLTHRKVAAIVTYADGSSSTGFNNELRKGMVHAEEKALAVHHDKSTKVTSISLMASGPPMNIKQAMPCENCTRLLIKRAAPRVKVVLFFNDHSGKVSLSLEAIAKRYKAQKKVTKTHDLSKTLLTDIDKKVVKFIMNALQAYDSSAQLYLTGSSAGVGGPTTLLAKDITGVPYWDIDLVLVQQKVSAPAMHTWFKDVYAKSLTHAGVHSKVLYMEEPSYVAKMGQSDLPGFISHHLYWGEGMATEIQPPNYQKNPVQPSPMDLSVGQSLTSILTPHYRRKKWYTLLDMADDSLPAHMRYTFVQELCKKKPNPALLVRYLKTIVSDDEAFASAVASMVRIPVGFNTLYVSRNPRLQLNFYREDITGNQDPHGHPAWARTSWYAPRGAIQKVVYHQPLPKGTRRLRGLPVQELQAVSNTNIQTTGGGRPFYGLKPLSPTLVLERSVVRKATLSGEDFPPWDPHHVAMYNLRGRVGISTHYKSLEEPAVLSTFEGLVNYKGLNPDDAMQVLDFRAELDKKIQKGLMPGAQRLGPAAVIYTPLDRKVDDMEPLPVSTPPKLAEELILGALRTAEELAKRSF